MKIFQKKKIHNNLKSSQEEKSFELLSRTYPYAWRYIYRLYIEKKLKFNNKNNYNKNGKSGGQKKIKFRKKFTKRT